MEGENKKIAFSGATEKDRYGHLLDKGREAIRKEQNKNYFS